MFPRRLLLTISCWENCRLLKLSPALMFKFDQGTLSQFGGWFKETLSVACLSRRCYRVVRSIFVSRKTGHQKINRGLFKQLPGFRDELMTYTLLQKLDTGDISADLFNKQLVDEKVSVRQASEQVVPPDMTMVLAENRQLKEENARLTQKCFELEDRLRKVEEENQDKNDGSIFDFEDQHIAEIATPRPQRQRPVYRCTFEADPSEESVIDDSFNDPHYNPAADNESEGEDSDSVHDPVVITDVPSPVTSRNTSVNEGDEDSSLLNKAFVVEEIRSWDPMQPVDLEPTVSLPVVPLCDDGVRKVFTEKRSENNDMPLKRKMRSRTKSSTFDAGQRVSVLFRYAGKDAAQEWCPAVIQKVILGGLRYSVRFDDGVNRIVKTNDIKLC